MQLRYITMLPLSENEMSCAFEIWENGNRCNLINVLQKTTSVPGLAAATTEKQNRKTDSISHGTGVSSSIFSLLRFAPVSLLCICLRVHTWLALNSIRAYLITYKWHASRKRARKVTHYIVRISKRTGS